MHRHMYRSLFYTLPPAESYVSRGCIPEADAFDLSNTESWGQAVARHPDGNPLTEQAALSDAASDGHLPFDGHQYLACVDAPNAAPMIIRTSICRAVTHKMSHKK